MYMPPPPTTPVLPYGAAAATLRRLRRDRRDDRLISPVVSVLPLPPARRDIARPYSFVLSSYATKREDDD